MFLAVIYEKTVVPHNPDRFAAGTFAVYETFKVVTTFRRVIDHVIRNIERHGIHISTFTNPGYTDDLFVC